MGAVELLTLIERIGAACGLGLYALVGVAIGAALIVLIIGGPIENAFARRTGQADERRDR